MREHEGFFLAMFGDLIPGAGEEVVDEGGYVVDFYLVVLVAVGSGVVNGAAVQQQVNQGRHVIDFHLAISVHVAADEGRLHAEVAGVVGAAVDVGVLFAHVVDVIGRALAANQAGAILEHVPSVAHGSRRPAIAHIDGAQIIAVDEHVSYLVDLRRVETAQVKTRQFITAIEHESHNGHLTGVQISQALDRLKIRHAIKPAVGGRRAGISERRVKHHSSHIGFGAIGVPTGIVVIGIQKVGSARANIAIVVVVERQRRVI